MLCTDLSGMPSFVRRLLVGPATVSRSGLERESLALSEMFSQKLAGATIPALMQRIPSELRSLACLGESSTRMGDLLGSPRVARQTFVSFLGPALFLLFSGWE